MDKRINCPECGASMLRQEWWGDHGREEILEDCPQCDYIYHWSYGHVVADSMADKHEEEIDNIQIRN